MTADYAPRNYNGNAVKTNLTTGMTNADTTTTIADSTGWPSSAFWMVLDAGTTTEEVVYVATRASLSLSGIVRNITGAGAFSHSAGGTKTCWPTGTHQDFQEANAVASALTTKGDSLWKGGTLSVAPARLAAGTDQQIVRYKAANSLGVETTHLGGIPVFTSTALRDAAIPSPVGGQVCYIFAGASTDGLYTYNGVSWRLVQWNAPWGEVGYAEATGAQTGITAVANITNATVTFTAVTGRKYETIGQANFVQNTNAAVVNLTLADASNVVLHQPGATYAAGSFGQLMVHKRETISAGSVTRKLRIQTSAGTVDMNQAATSPTTIRVMDIGPSGVPT